MSKVSTLMAEYGFTKKNGSDRILVPEYSIGRRLSQDERLKYDRANYLFYYIIVFSDSSQT